MIAPVSFASLGFRTDVPRFALPELTWMIQEKIPNIALTASVFVSGLYWLINRRMELARQNDKNLEG